MAKAEKQRPGRLALDIPIRSLCITPSMLSYLARDVGVRVCCWDRDEVEDEDKDNDMVSRDDGFVSNSREE